MKTSEIISSRKSWKLILSLLGVVLGVLIIVSLIKFGTVFFFIPFWFWTVDKIINLTGANLWIARGFAALFVLPFFYLIKLIFSWKPEKRKIGWILLSVLTASLCFSMFFLSEDIYFSFKTGQAQKWYIVTPEGKYEFSDSPGYNTLWGIKYEKVTPAIIKKYIEQEKKEKITGKPTSNKGKEKVVPKEPGDLVLSPEEEEFLVKELTKYSYPENYGQEKKLYNAIKMLEESNKLANYNNILCVVARVNLDDQSGGFFGYSSASISEDMVRYLGNIGDEESLPTLFWISTQANSSELREMSKTAFIAIKAGRKNVFLEQAHQRNMKIAFGVVAFGVVIFVVICFALAPPRKIGR